ncbi:MAG TPA: hypothetical protein VK724_14225 [Bryobacteraceae bacterium]|jgi:uncharacterized protein (TIGR03437 family)|nr:hypothetical protein [Bryobacteraceae bacterium]
MIGRAYYGLLACVVVLPAMAQTSVPFIYSALNSANYSSTLAQGSLFVVFGTGIGPAQYTGATSLPLPPQLGGTSISVTSGTTTLICPMVYSLLGTAAAILPSNTPTGPATVTLTFNKVVSPFPAQVTVVPSAIGLYTSSSSGLGPGPVTALNGVLKTFAAASKSSDIATVWGTGLGPISGPDANVPSAFPNFPGVEVFVGTQSAKVIYAGRSGCCVGVDQISFEVPSGVAGCFVPLAVRTSGGISNFISFAVSNDGGPCSDAAPTIPVNLMNQAAAGQSITAAAFAVGPTSVLRALGFEQRNFLAARLSQLLHVQVSPEDVAKLLLAGQTHDRRALRRAMAKYAKSLRALDPASKAEISAAVNLTMEGAYAAFKQYTAPATVAAAVSGLFPSQGTCTVQTPLTASAQRTSTGLDAGSSLTLSGQAGAWTLTQNHTGQYQVAFGSAPIGQDVAPGAYTISSAGGSDLKAFSATLKIAADIVWTNKAGISTIDRSQPLTLNWSGGTSPASVLIGGYIASETTQFVGFVCVEDAGKGTFTIPSFILSALPPAETGGAMFIAAHPLSQPVTIPGVDLAYAINGSSDSESVVYQ